MSAIILLPSIISHPLKFRRCGKPVVATLRTMIRFLAALLSLWPVAGSAAADSPAPVKAVSLAKCAAPPVIDGVLGAGE